MELNVEDTYLEYVRLCNERDEASRHSEKLLSILKVICDHPADYRYDEVILGRRYHYCKICGKSLDE